MRVLTCIYGSRGGAGGIKPEPWNPLPETLSEALNSSATVILEGLDIAIEPNETSHDSVTFVVPTYCTAVQIRLFIPTRRKNDMGWTAVIYHDTQPSP